MYDIVIFPHHCAWGILCISGCWRSFDKYKNCDSRKKKLVQFPKVCSVCFYTRRVRAAILILIAGETRSCVFIF